MDGQDTASDYGNEEAVQAVQEAMAELDLQRKDIKVHYIDHRVV